MQWSNCTDLFTKCFFLTIQAPFYLIQQEKVQTFFFNGQICEWRELFFPKFIIGGDNFAAGM